MTDRGINSFVEQIVEFDNNYTPNRLLEMCSNKEILKKTNDEDHKKKDWAVILCFGTAQYIIVGNN